MANDTKVNELVINKLTRDQYAQAKNNNLIVATELYMITDQEEDNPFGNIPASDTPPGEGNVWIDTSADMRIFADDIGAISKRFNDTAYGAYTFTNDTDSTSTTTGAIKIAGGLGVAKNIYANNVFGAVWNDYAEYRNTLDVEAGRCVAEKGDGDLYITEERLIPGCSIVSDTFGFSIGKTEIAGTPLAVSGRVLAYTDTDRFTFKPGDSVCSGPNGTVSRMTREEIKEYPDCIIGFVSEIPRYKTWGSGNVNVDNRIWIKLR